MKDNIWIQKGVSCKSCGWEVICCCVNWDAEKLPESKYSDWWCYCSNKTCENHKGEELFQNEIEWVKHDN